MKLTRPHTRRIGSKSSRAGHAKRLQDATAIVVPSLGRPGIYNARGRCVASAGTQFSLICSSSQVLPGVHYSRWRIL